MITLYDYWRSSASYRLRIALGLAELEWTTISVDLVAGEQRSAENLARNPQGLIPALDIDGRMMTQSLAILEYLNDTRAMGWLPEAPAERATVRAQSYAIAMEVHPVCNLRVAKHAVACSNGALSMEQWMQAFIAQGLAAFEDMLQGGSYCYGDGVTIADICLIPQLYNAHRWNVSLDKMPKIQRIEETLSNISAFAAAHPDQTPR